MTSETISNVPVEFEQLLRNDEATVQQITSAVKRCSKYTAGPLSGTEASEALHDLIKACSNNLGLILPYFFKYPKDAPMSLRLHTPFYPVFQLNSLTKMVIIGGRQIAKSSSVAARHILKLHLFPGYNITYLCPRIDQTKIFASRLRQLLMHYTYRDAVLTPLQPNAMFYKEFVNNSSVLLAYALTTADRVRSRSTDDLDLDEVQDLDEDYLAPILETTRASSWKNVTYMGTAKSVDTLLESLWQESSMAERICPCHHCNHENIPNLDGKVMDMIQPAGLSCVKCGRLLNIDKAFWLHAVPDKVLSYPGFHIPQIVLPYFVLDPVQWASIYIDKTTRDYHSFISENLGISTDTGSKEINEMDLKACCTLGDNLPKLQVECNDRKYAHVISGMDWGGSDYQPMLKTKKSYTVHTILGVKDPDHVDVLFFRRYAGMDYTAIIRQILDDHKRLNGTHFASDFGAGQVYNWMIRQYVNMEMHYIFDYSSTTAGYLQIPQTSPMPNQYTLNRTESISWLFHKIREKRLHFPRWEIMHEYLKEFLSVYRAPSESSTGKRVFLYRKQGNRTDDSLHAVNFAYTLARLLFGEVELYNPNIEINPPPKVHSMAPEITLDDVLYERNQPF